MAPSDREDGNKDAPPTRQDGNPTTPRHIGPSPALLRERRRREFHEAFDAVSRALPRLFAGEWHSWTEDAANERFLVMNTRGKVTLEARPGTHSGWTLSFHGKRGTVVAESPWILKGLRQLGLLQP